jgi:hypothetical protein
MTRKIWLKAPETMVEGWRVWVLDGNRRRELSHVATDGHGAVFYCAFDSREQAVRSASRFYRAALASTPTEA